MSEVKEKFNNLIKDQSLHIFDDPFVIKDFLKNVEDYLNWNTLNEAINSNFVSWQLIKNGTPLDVPHTAKFWAGRQQDKQFILDHVNDGVGFVIARCCILNDKLKSIVSDIQEIFPVACDIHIYGSKGKSKSFIPHTDRPSNFIIQASGDTDWIVFKNRVSNMLLWDDYAMYEPKRGELTPALEVTLSPGDLLHIPPRTYHAALPSMPRLSMSIPSISLDYKDLLNIHPHLAQELSQLTPDVNRYEINK